MIKSFLFFSTSFPRAIQFRAHHSPFPRPGSDVVKGRTGPHIVFRILETTRTIPRYHLFSPSRSFLCPCSFSWPVCCAESSLTMPPLNYSSTTSTAQIPQTDRKGKKKAVVPTSPVQHTTPDQPSASKRSRKAQPSADQEGRYSLRRKSEDKLKGEKKVDVKGKNKEMPKKAK